MFNKRVFKVLAIFIVFVFLFSFNIVHAENILTEEEFFQYESENLIIRYFNLQIENKEEIQRDSDTPIKSGDAILITTPEGQNILIDSGINYTGENLNQYLNEIGVEKLDYAFATHPHWDHIGGFLTLFNTIEIDQLYHVNVPNDTSTYAEYLELIERNNIENEYIEAGNTLEIEKDIKFEVLNPPAGTSPENLPPAEDISTRQINNESLVMNFSFNDISFLIIGDIYRDREVDLTEIYDNDELEANILHAPHHGEETGSSFELIEAVNPDYTVISRDELASISIFNRYRSYDIEVFVTGLNGHILLESDGYDINIFTEEVIDSPFLH